MELSMKAEDGDESMDASSSNDSPGIGLPENFRGIYELFALVTHKGRSSSSGHYIGWVKSGSKGDWVCFDDESASYCKEENILLLSGGGDRSLAYICFYRAKE
jgi:ubiquitin carboxyl-terminal hydrolase 14